MNKKLITIDNYKDYVRFIKRLKIYKSFFYKKTSFKLNDSTSNEDLVPIIKALNIKDRDKRMEYVYDEVCSYIDRKMTSKDYCEFKNNRCIVQRKYNSPKFNGCCHTCIYQKNKTCTTSNISCKLFFCPTIKRKYKLLKAKNIDILKLYSLRQRILIHLDFYTSREEVLKDLKSRFFFLTLLKVIHRKTN